MLVSSSPRRRELLARFVPGLMVTRLAIGELPVKSQSDLLKNARYKLDSVSVEKITSLVRNEIVSKRNRFEKVNDAE